MLLQIALPLNNNNCGKETEKKPNKNMPKDGLMMLTCCFTFTLVVGKIVKLAKRKKRKKEGRKEGRITGMCCESGLEPVVPSVFTARFIAAPTLTVMRLQK